MSMMGNEDGVTDKKYSEFDRFLCLFISRGSKQLTLSASPPCQRNLPMTL